MTTVIIATVTSIIFLSIIVLTIREEKRREMIRFQKEGINIFGVKMKTNDYFSFINTLISYLMIDMNNKLDLSKFIDNDLLKQKKYNQCFHIIENTINMFPLVVCTYEGDGIFVLNKEETAKKMEKYQKDTQMDDYIIPLFDMRIIERYSTLFNYSAKYQQSKNMENILSHEIMTNNFHESDMILKRIEPISHTRLDDDADMVVDKVITNNEFVKVINIKR